MLSIQPNKDKAWLGASSAKQVSRCNDNSIKFCMPYLHDDGKDIISYQGGFLPILGVDMVEHDLHTVHSMW